MSSQIEWMFVRIVFQFHCCSDECAYLFMIKLNWKLFIPNSHSFSVKCPKYPFDHFNHIINQPHNNVLDLCLISLFLWSNLNYNLFVNIKTLIWFILLIITIPLRVCCGLMAFLILYARENFHPQRELLLFDSFFIARNHRILHVPVYFYLIFQSALLFLHLCISIASPICVCCCVCLFVVLTYKTMNISDSTSNELIVKYYKKIIYFSSWLDFIYLSFIKLRLVLLGQCWRNFFSFR